MIKNIFTLLLLTIASIIAKAQTQNMSVQQCIDYALANQNKIKSARIDEQIQLAKNSQVASAVYPTVSLNGSLSYMPIISKSRSRGDLFDFSGLYAAFLPSAFNPNYVAPAKQEYSALQFALPVNASCTLQVQQIIFNSDVLVALQARKTLEELSSLSTKRTEEQLKVDVSKAYYNCLIATKRIALLNDNIQLLDVMEGNLSAMFKEGFVEKIDVDKITVQKNNLATEKEKVQSLVELGTQLLKFQMGMPLQNDIQLTDDISLEKLNNNLLVEEVPNYNNRIEMQLLGVNKKLNEYNYTRIKKSNLPTVVAVGNFQLASQMKRFSELVTLPYYPGSVIALSASMGLYDGGKRKYSLQEAKLNLTKNNLDIETFKQGVDLETANSKTSLRNNIKSLQTQNANMKLAEKVYTIAQKKSKEGVGSTLEILQAQTALKEAQTNYLGALYDATISQIDLQKALGEFK